MIADRPVIDRVNTHVNSLIRYKTDRENYGTSEHWAKPSEIESRMCGDCEDYAIYKAYLLVRDFHCDPAQFRLAVVRHPDITGGHIVLLAECEERCGFLLRRKRYVSYVLDNRTDYLATLEKSGYTIERDYPVDKFIVG